METDNNEHHTMSWAHLRPPTFRGPSSARVQRGPGPSARPAGPPPPMLAACGLKAEQVVVGTRPGSPNPWAVGGPGSLNLWTVEWGSGPNCAPKVTGPRKLWGGLVDRQMPPCSGRVWRASRRGRQHALLWASPVPPRPGGATCRGVAVALQSGLGLRLPS